MKTFTLAWEEYMDSANPRATRNWQVLCAGSLKIQAKDDQSAKRLWKRMFPHSKVLSVNAEIVLDKTA